MILEKLFSMKQSRIKKLYFFIWPLHETQISQGDSQIYKRFDSLQLAES
jgi:hypothetical protein